MVRFFGYFKRCLLNPIRSSFSVSEDSERKDSFVLLLLRPICTQEDSSTLFLKSTFLFFFLLPLFLFLTLIDFLHKDYRHPFLRLLGLQQGGRLIYFKVPFHLLFFRLIKRRRIYQCILVQCVIYGTKSRPLLLLRVSETSKYLTCS